MVKNQAYRRYTFRTAIGITILAVLLLAISAGAQSDQTGNRIWDITKGTNETSYIWNSFSFSGFYYNLDDNLTTEELTINNIKRNIAEGDIDYKTSPIEVSFEHSGFGSYRVIGFMADKYFAGYSTKSVISERREISTIGSGQLQRVLLDDEDRRTVTVGGTLTLREGYVLRMREIDIGAGPGQIWVVLLKDGAEVDSDVVAAGDTYVYSKRVGVVTDLPIIAVRFESVFRGREVNAAFIRGVFQISESFTQVRTGDRYGVMEITGVGGDQIIMENRNSVDLSAGNTVDLMGNLKIIVADNSSVLRFGLSAERTGTYEVRGTIHNVTNAWTPLNFGLNIGGTSIGFYYDMDEDVGTENLAIREISGTSIPEGGLVYNTSSQDVSFDFSPFGSYRVIGFTADKYFAGYSANTRLTNPTTTVGEISTLAQGQLHRVLIDDDIQRTVALGGTLTLGEGYVLKADDIDPGARTMLLSLLKDGNVVDTTPLSAGQTYVYTKRAGAVSDLPLIIMRLETVFSGRETSAAFIRGLFQISEAATSVRTGDSYGQMEIRSVGADGIRMDNSNSISLSRGSTVDLMGNIRFRVADSSEVRFYPFVMVTPEMVANQLIIDAPSRATAGDTIRIRVTAGGSAVEGVSIDIEPGIGLIDNRTDRNGDINYTLPRTLNGTYNMTATKIGYQKATRSIEVQAFIENRLSIDAPSRANQFEAITILVTFNGTAVSGADVTYDNVTIGVTGSDGTVNYTPETSGLRTISASKTGFITASRDMEVRMPFSEFRALDINITPAVVFTDGTTVIRSNVTNAGTKNDTLPVVLIINSTEVDSMSVTLAPNEVKEISFTHEVTLPAGNYTVEVLGQKGTLEVKEAPVNVFLIVGIIIIMIAAGAVIIYFLTAKKTKIQEVSGKTI